MSDNSVPNLLDSRTEAALESTEGVLTLKADLLHVFVLYLATPDYSDLTDKTKAKYLMMFQSVNEIIDQAHIEALANLNPESNEAK